MAEKRSALVVATSEYEDARLAPLAGPGRDAEALETVLGDAEIGGFDVQLALNSPLAELRTTLDSFFADRTRDELLLVHFSGHGLKDDDGQLYLAAADTRIDRLMSTAVEASWVSKLMTRCRSEKIALFLDCCFGGAFMTGLTHRAGVDTAGAKETFSGTGRFVITASDAMQYSFEGGQRVEGAAPEPSPFTRALVEGLRTGEADRNDDGFVSINELFDYLEDRVRQLSPAQTPTKSAFNQVGDWVIAQSMRAPTIRILPASLQEQLKSDAPRDRMAAAFTLRDLIAASDPRTSDAAQKALERLTADDSRLVAEAAERLFGRMPDDDALAGTVTSTPLSESALPPALKDALLAAGNAPADAGTPQVEPSALPPVDPIEPAAARASSVAAPADASPMVPPQAPLASAAAAGATNPAIQPASPPQQTVPASTPWKPPPAAPKAVATSGPLWGAPPPAEAGPGAVALPLAAPAAGVAKSASHPASGGWTFGRAFTRAALGTIIGFGVGVLYEIADDVSNASEDLRLTVLLALLAIAAVFAAIVAVIEKFVPALRIPGGSLYAVVGHNRWIVAGTLGLIPGFLLIGAGGYWIFLALMVVGFLAAEAIVGRRSPKHQPTT